MQTKPSGWAELFASSHKTEYKFVIDGVEYTKSNIQGTPIITKPYMDKLCIGRCCSGTLSLQIRPIDSTTIPKAASVVAYCRLRSQDGATVTDWVEQGLYYVSSRKTNGEILSLMCRDSMMKAGAVYLDYTAFTEWPVTMTAVVNEIASIMGISVDSRTVISTNADYVVSYPNDLLMSEILSMIAAAHGGNFIITEKNELRLLPLPHILSSADNKCDIGGAYQIYETESTTQMISRVTLEDDAGNKFTAGSDGGLEVTAKCSYATQAIADDLCASGTGSLYAVKFTPYSVKGAYLDPCTELGDLLQLTSKGTTMYHMIASMNIRCNVSFNADVSCKSDFDDEEEFPYISARDLQASRYIRADQKYHGNRIDRVNGFTSEYMVNGKVAARLIANSTVFSMQRVVGDLWEDCIYFDAVTQKYVITGNVTIKGVITAESLSTAGSTTINGANITTGTIDASKVSVTNLSASNIVSGTLSASRISGGTLDASQITVSNLSASSITSGTLNASKVTISNLSASSITSGTLDASKVTVKNLDASSITSGTISADRVDISSLKVDKIYTTTSTGVTRNVAIASSTTTRLMVGGDGTWNFDYTTIYAGVQIEIQAYGDLTSNSKLLFDTKNHAIRPETSGLWSLGMNAWFFKTAYIRDGIYLKDSHQCITSTDIGTSLYPWSKVYTTSAYVSNLYLNNTLFDPDDLSISQLTYSSSIYASLNSSKQFIPASSTGYYLGSSTYPWQYAYVTNLYINGTKFDPSASNSNFAGSTVNMGGSTSYYILCNTSRELRPYSTSTTYPCYLGTSTYYWHYAYIGSNTVSIGSGTTSKLGFFGTTPVAKQTLSTTSNNMNYTSVTSSNYLYALNNLIGILKNKYGLIG